MNNEIPSFKGAADTPASVEEPSDRINDVRSSTTEPNPPTAASTETKADATPAERASVEAVPPIIVDSASTPTPTQDGDHDAFTPANVESGAPGMETISITPAVKSAAPSSQEAEADSPDGDVVEDADQYTQEECERQVRACREGDTEIGYWLHLLKQRIETKDWKDYCLKTFGFSQPYADKRIRAWKARHDTPIKLKGRLPQTADFWAAVSDIDLDLRTGVLEALVRNCDQNEKISLRLKAKDVRETKEWQDAHARKRRKSRNSVTSAVHRILEGDDIQDVLQGLPADQHTALTELLVKSLDDHKQAMDNLDKALNALASTTGTDAAT